MESIQFDFSPYSFNAVALFIIGVASAIYLSQLKEKSSAIRLITTALIIFALGMVSMFANSIVLWGSALLPATDTFAVLSMAAMINFGYHYPRRTRSIEACLTVGFSVIVSLIAIGYSIFYAYQIIFKHAFHLAIPTVFWILNPLTFVVALAVMLYRTMALHQERVGHHHWRVALSALIHPLDRQVRVLRNFSLALSIGIIQGVATGLGTAGLIHSFLGDYLINLSLLLMIVTIVYASFELTPIHPSIIIRLVGLSLIIMLTILGTYGLYAVYAGCLQVDEQKRSDVEVVRKAVQTGNIVALPDSIVYVAAKLDEEPYRLLYNQELGFDHSFLERESSTNATPVWNYFIVNKLGLANQDIPVISRYGSHPIGSYYQYAGYTFNNGDVEYEVGFRLVEMSEVTQNISLGVIYAVLIGSGFFLLFVPRFFHSNLVGPLDLLLDGVRQADSGNLDIEVPVIHGDEVGFLTAAFNKMTASLRTELSQRQRAETELRQLTVSLEQRVADRTRELTALYEVSAVASQERRLDVILSESLTRTMEALQSNAGAIYILRSQAENSQEKSLKLVTYVGLPEELVVEDDVPVNQNDLFRSVIAESEAVLINDLTNDPRLPASFQKYGPGTFLVAPLHSDGQVLGVMGLFRGAEQGFNVEEVALLASIADQIGVAVQSDTLRQQAELASVMEERQRLARDLHDSVTQSLYGLVTFSEAGQTQVEMEQYSALQGTLSRIGETTRKAIREMRLFIHQLRPSILENEGLVGALHLRLAAVEGRSDTQARLLADEDMRLPAFIESALYQIAQEALNNSLRHADAKTVQVLLRYENKTIIMDVIDDGCGFEPETVVSGGMGLENMRVRAAEIGGECDIISSPGSGTVVRVVVGSKE